MHELSIAQGLVRTAVEQAAARGAARVHRLEVVLGSLAGIQHEALTFCFPLVARETLCEGAELHIHTALAQGQCEGCGASCEVSDLMQPCPKCDRWPLKLEGGTEMSLRSLEVS